ncbi:MAG: hypothetical protein WBM40_13915 [Thiohalocapsa sp.]
MKKLLIYITATLSVCAASGAFATGAPKPEHPCYEVADCKTQGSRKEFSACVKAHPEEANANAACAAFRKDKPAYMEQHGIDGVDSLFEGS